MSDVSYNLCNQLSKNIHKKGLDCSKKRTGSSLTEPEVTDCESKEANKTSKTHDQEWHPVKDTLRSTSPDDSLSRKKIHQNFFTCDVSFS